MFVKNGKKTTMYNILTLVFLIVIVLLTRAQMGLAQSGSAKQAFATKPVANVRGTRVNIWTANHATGHYFIVSLTGLCTAEPCTSSEGFFETGLVKGLITTEDPNQLQQFASYKKKGAYYPVNVFGLGNLNNLNWYEFQTLYSNSAQRWEAWRNGVPRFTTTVPNFTVGARVVCGAEGMKNSWWQGAVPLGAECNNMRYKVSTTWVQHDYTNTQIAGSYCVYKPYTYGAIGWGPC